MTTYHLIQAWREQPTSINTPPDFAQVTNVNTPPNVPMNTAARDELVTNVFQGTPVADNFKAFNISSEAQ